MKTLRLTIQAREGSVVGGIPPSSLETWVGAWEGWWVGGIPTSSLETWEGGVCGGRNSPFVTWNVSGRAWKPSNSRFERGRDLWWVESPLCHPKCKWKGCRCHENPSSLETWVGGRCGGWNTPFSLETWVEGHENPPSHDSSEGGVCGGWNTPSSLETWVEGLPLPWKSSDSRFERGRVLWWVEYPFVTRNMSGRVAVAMKTLCLMFQAREGVDRQGRCGFCCVVSNLFKRISSRDAPCIPFISLSSSRCLIRTICHHCGSPWRVEIGKGEGIGGDWRRWSNVVVGDWIVWSMVTELSLRKFTTMRRSDAQW